MRPVGPRRARVAVLPVGTGNAWMNAPILRKDVWRWEVMTEEFMRVNENRR